MLIVSISSFESLSSLVNSNILLITSVMFMLTLIYIMIDCTFFLSHLCYYIIAHYIQLLVIYSDMTEDNELQMNKRSNIIIQ